MSQLEEVGKVYYLAKKGMIEGIFSIAEDKERFFSFWQETPFSEIEQLDDRDRMWSKESHLVFEGDHARQIFLDTCTYFARRGYSVVTIHSALSHGDYRDSMWELFKKHILPAEVIAEIKQRIKAMGTNIWPAITEIGYFYLINPEVKNRPAICIWEEWFNSWFPER